ncbi:MAG: DHH family phosphoesterase [Flavobacteriales bacterium]|nr:DHH family phosphoesterase [Flavobacteriales bacterium]|tara:strand:+ start:75 stop:1070 length:996 start_codon:yes stop_codon:yes gene_type:complete
MYDLNYLSIQDKLSSRKNIVITTHKSPDGDALGSSLALFFALYKNHNVNIIVPNEFPNYLNWMPSSNKIKVYENETANCDLILDKADIIFCLDFNKLYRTYLMSEKLKLSDAYMIMIDHHEEPDQFCDQILSNPLISSTAELVYEFLLNLNFQINRNIATCLYTGIITDTGCLKYPNVTNKTHEIIAQLMSLKINHSIIHQKLFDNQNKSRFDLLKICLNNLQVFHDYNAAVIFLNESDLIKCNYKKGDTEGFVNIPLSIKNIYFSTFFVEFKDGIKISFRSQGDFDVNLFSKNYFNGGGHKNAAGGFIDDKNIQKVLVYFLDSLKDFSNN